MKKNESNRRYRKKDSANRDYVGDYSIDDADMLDEARYGKMRSPEKQKRRQENEQSYAHTIDRSLLKEALIMEVQPKGCFARPVDAVQDILWLSVRKSLRGKKQTAKNVIATGDRVLYLPQDETEGVVEEVLERTSKISRPATRGQDRIEHVIVANADQIAIVASVRMPDIRPGLIDRYLIAAQHNGLHALLVINKIDLDPGEECDRIAEIYERVNCQVFRTNALTLESVDSLREALHGHSTVFCGHSGVGKSSLLNCLMPQVNIKVGIVPEQYNKGRHTTTTAKLYDAGENSFYIDTPGVREFGLWGVKSQDLDRYYPEIYDVKNMCKYTTCQHGTEEYCAVLAAIEEGAIHPKRLETYLRIKDTLKKEYY